MTEKCDRKGLRKSFYAVRARQSADQGKVQALGSALRAWLGKADFQCIGLYAPFRGEPDIVPAVLAAAGQSGAKVALPVIDDLKAGLMHYAVWDGSGDGLAPGQYGILEPRDGQTVVPDVILSPCVAVSPQGIRLGNGGGFFDRYLPAVRARGINPQTVAVAFDALVSEAVIAQSHDAPFDWIATESGVVRAQGKP